MSVVLVLSLCVREGKRGVVMAVLVVVVVVLSLCVRECKRGVRGEGVRGEGLRVRGVCLCVWWW